MAAPLDPDADAKRVLRENCENLAKLAKSAFLCPIDVKSETPKILAEFEAHYKSTGAKSLSAYLDSSAYDDHYKIILTRYIVAKNLRKGGMIKSPRKKS